MGISSARMVCKQSLFASDFSPCAPAEAHWFFFCGIFAREIWREIWREFRGILSDPPKKAQNFQGNFGAFFARNFVAQKNISCQNSLCRRATLRFLIARKSRVFECFSTVPWRKRAFRPGTMVQGRATQPFLNHGFARVTPAIFVILWGSEERSPCFQWVECRFVIFAVFVETAPFWQRAKIRGKLKGNN